MKAAGILTFTTFVDDTKCEPACSISADKEGTCHFLAFRQFGQQGVCIYPTDSGIKTDVFRDENGRGYIRPHAQCPFWKDRE